MGGLVVVRRMPDGAWLKGSDGGVMPAGWRTFGCAQDDDFWWVRKEAILRVRVRSGLRCAALSPAVAWKGALVGRDWAE